MTRRLPWKKDIPAQGIPAPLPRSRSTTSPIQSTTGRPIVRDDSLPPAQRASPGPGRVTPINRRPCRATSRSTSPPPAPPQEQYMVGGPSKDDKWRMVEDEFLDIAHQFTAHLHAAEYERLKKAATDKTVAREMANISQPVTSPITESVRQPSDVSHVRSRQKDALRWANDGAEDLASALAPWDRTSLQNLMESPRRRASKLKMSSMGSVSTVTRAAAGFTSASKSQQAGMVLDPKVNVEENGDDDDTDDTDESDDVTDSDLDGVSPFVRTSAPSNLARRHTDTVGQKRGAEQARTEQHRKAPELAPRVKKERPVLLGDDQGGGQGDDEDDSDGFGLVGRRMGEARSRIRQRRLQQETKRRDQMRRMSGLADVPSFP